MKKIILLIFGLALFAASCGNNANQNTLPSLNPETAQQTNVFENSKLKLELLAGWKANEVTANPAALNVTKGSYVLYVNTNASQAGGAEGGRFAEIAMGSPSADAVVTVQPSEPCGISVKKTVLDNYERNDLYVSSKDKTDYCAVPTNSSTVWYFSYINRDSEGYFIHNWNSKPSNLVITMSYNSKLINEFPMKDSQELVNALAEMSQMVKSLQIK